ncbi:MAG TPA: F0F1 ATP synthase subunit gamma [Sphingomonas sp.]
MSERLADVGRRIDTVRQLGAVVNAMRGMAGARAQQGRALLPAIRAYAETAGHAIGQARRLKIPSPPIGGTRPGKPGLIVFGAEQGFAGAFAEQVLNATAGEFASAHVFLVGGRAASLAAERELPIGWQASLPSRAAALADMATEIVEALYDYLGEAGAVPVTMVFPVWRASRGVAVTRRTLLPLDAQAFPSDDARDAPLTNLPPALLIESLAQEYVFAQLCEAAVEAFAAENEARMATMAAAKTNIDGKLQALQLEERLTRQDEITAEVVELAAGARSRRMDRHP